MVDFTGIKKISEFDLQRYFEWLLFRPLDDPRDRIAFQERNGPVSSLTGQVACPSEQSLLSQHEDVNIMPGVIRSFDAGSTRFASELEDIRTQAHVFAALDDEDEEMFDLDLDDEDDDEEDDDDEDLDDEEFDDEEFDDEDEDFDDEDLDDEEFDEEEFEEEDFDDEDDDEEDDDLDDFEDEEEF